MKKLDVLVVRKNGEVLTYEGINDMYTPVCLAIDVAGLNEDTIEKLTKAYFNRSEKTNTMYDEQEAKDFCGEYGEITIAIENVEIILN